MKSWFLFCVFVFCLSKVFSMPQTQTKCLCEVNEKKAKAEFNQYTDNKQEEKAKKLALSLIRSKNPSCKVMGCDFMVSLFHQMGNTDSALVYLSIAEKNLRYLGCNKKAIMEFHSSNSINYFMRSDLENGIKESIKALELAQELGDFRNQAYLYSNLSLSFYRLNQFEKGKAYSRKLMAIIPKLDDEYIKIDMQRYVAESYYNYYKGKGDVSSLDSIGIFANKALVSAKRTGDNETAITCYILLHHKPFVKNNFEQSLVFLDSALNILQTVKVYGSDQKMYRINLLKTDIYLQMKKAGFALQSADSSLKYARRLDDKAYLVSSYERLYKANKLFGNLDQSIYYLEKYMSLKDSVQNMERTSVVNELEQKYNKVQNEKIIKEQNHRNNLLLKQNEIDNLQIRFLWVGVVLILVILIALILFFRQRSFKQRQLLAETEQRLNRSRINPHFFFNILGSLQNLLITSEDKRNSVLHLARFSKIMRQTLESSYNDNVSISQEIDFLKEYLELQKLRKNNQFDFSIEIDDQIDPEDFFVPSMLLQPFIENALEHGFGEWAEKGLLKISFLLKNNEILVSIEDNGKGFQQSQPKDKNHISRATQIIKDRLILLNKQHKSNSRFNITSGANGKGTTVVVYIPDNLQSNLRSSKS